MAAIDELDTLLQALQALKPPGVSKSKIEAINALCIVNVAIDSALVEKIAAHSRSTPSTHKLGVLYAIDSVTRQWVEKAKQTGQALIGSAAAPGTYASGVHKMTEVLPGLMNDAIVSVPEGQKEKIAKLIDIWGKANTFPADMLSGFKRKLEGPSQSMRTFPPSKPPKADVPAQPAPSNGAALGSSAPSLDNNGFTTQAVVPPLAGILPQQPPAAAPQVPMEQLAAALGLLNQNPALSQQPAPPPVAEPPSANLAQLQALLFAQQNIVPQPVAAPPPPPMPIQPPPPAADAGAADIAQQFQIISQLLQKGLSPEQIAQVLQALGITIPPMPPVPAAPVAASSYAPVPPAPSQYLPPAQPPAPPAFEQYDYRRPRSRSRSRDRDSKRRRVTPPQRRESPVYGIYDPEAAQNESSRHAGNDNRGRNNRRGNGHGRSPSGRQSGGAPAGGPQPKYITFDRNLPKGHIRVLSRTLFVGGVAATESEIRSIFSRYGNVQTCIVNQDKRHAFVKMVNRQDALNAKAGMDGVRDADVTSKIRSTKWGVGFGPRECSDYSTGVSVVPISALTDADKRWLLTAEYGGTGGQPLEPGMVVEEPDIEIGAGVSSKAISRRIESSAMKRQGGRPEHGRKADNNPPQERYGHDRPPEHAPSRPAHNQPQGRYRDQQPPPAPEPAKAKAAAPGMLRPEPNTVGVPPAVPTFGFQLPGFNIR